MIKIRELYMLFLKTGNVKIFQYKKETIILFEKAETKDRLIPIAQDIGLGYVNSGVGSTFKNFPTRNSNFTLATFELFEITIGTFKQNIKNTFNPIYWIDFIIFFPKILMKYFGVVPEVLATKIVQVFYWFFLIALGIFRNKIEVIITNYLDKFF